MDGGDGMSCRERGNTTDSLFCSEECRTSYLSYLNEAAERAMEE